MIYTSTRCLLPQVVVIVLAIAPAMLAAPAAAQSTRSVEALAPNLRSIFVLWDTDGDGTVSGAEYNRSGGGPNRYDLDGDGALTAEEYGRFHATVGAVAWPSYAPRHRPPLGHYVCTTHEIRARGREEEAYAGEFTILADRRYSVVGTMTMGRVSVTGPTIRFLGGPYDRTAGEIARHREITEIVLSRPGSDGAPPSTWRCSSAR